MISSDLVTVCYYDIQFSGPVRLDRRPGRI